MFQVIETDVPGVSAPDAGLDPKLLKYIDGKLESAALSVTRGAKEITDLMLEKVQLQIAGIKPKTAIIGIQVNGGAIARLKTEASPVLPRLVINAKLGLNSLLVGPAGCGKTHAAAQLAEALGLPFYHVSFTAGASETWLYGRQTPTGFVPGPLHLASKNGGVLLGDELDAADANMALCLNTLLANGHIYNPINGETITKHKDFVFVGTANTFGKGGNGVYTGRNRLDAATLDRFVTLNVTYSESIESALCPDAELLETLRFARKKLETLSSQEIVSYRAIESTYKQVSAGIPLSDAIASLTASWPDEIRATCFPDKPKAKAKPKTEPINAGKVIDSTAEDKSDTGASYEPF